MFEPISSVIPLLEDQGYKINDPWDIVDIFEKKLAKFAGSKYAVSVDNCTDGMFLCLKYLNFNGEITIPSNTWLSVPGMIMHTGCTVKFENVEWSGIYQLKPTTVYDGATRFTKDMYIPGSYQCVSFHHRKILKIGKGGMIFTDDKDACKVFVNGQLLASDKLVSGTAGDGSGDYTVSSNTEITFAFPLLAGDVVTVEVLKEFTI